MSSEKTIEKYYSSDNEVKLSSSQQNYVLLNQPFPYVSSSLCSRAYLYTQPNSILAGTFYNNRTLQTNTITDTINLTIQDTLALDNGIIVFITSRNFVNLYAGYTIKCKSTFQSGIYEGKDIEIIHTVLQGDDDLINEYTIIY